MDHGIENIKVAEVQYAFCEHHSDDMAAEKSFRFGTSPANIISTMNLCVLDRLISINPITFHGCFLRALSA